MNYTCRRCQTPVHFLPKEVPRPTPTGIKGMIYAFERNAYMRTLCRECLNTKRRELAEIMSLIDRYAR